MNINKPTIVVVDYGMANLQSVKNAYDHIGLCHTIISNNPSIIKDADGDEAYLDWDLPNWKLGEAGRGTYSYTGGTGKYEGLSGDGGYFYGHTITIWDDGTAGGYSVWNREP